MTRDLLFAVAAGVASALAGLAFLARAPGATLLLIYLGPLPLMLTGLALGLRPALAACGVGAMVAGLLAGPSAMLLYVVGHALPGALVVWLGLGRRAVPPTGGRTEASPRASNDAPLSGRAGESPRASNDAPLSGRAGESPRASNDAPLSGRAGVNIVVGDEAGDGPAVAPAEWYPHGHIVAWLAALAAVLIAFTALALSSGEGFRDSVTEHIEKGMTALLPTLSETERSPLVALMSGLFPGWIGVSWVAMGAVNAVAAETILTRTGRALRPKPAWSDIALPDWLSWLLVGAALLALIGPGDVGYTGRNLALALAFPHFLLGLAVVHGLANRTPQPRALLVGFYVVLFISAWALLAVAAVGVLEHWIGIRNRLPGGPPPGSNGPEA